jgi:hypothetical protein
MPALPRFASSSLLGLLSLAAILALPADGRADPKPAAKTPAPPKPAPQPAQKPNTAQDAAKAGSQLAEAELLGQAYVLLLNENADYNGHRGSAMNSVKKGFEELRSHVMAHGTPAQKAEVKKQQVVIRNADIARGKAPTILKSQKASDDALRQAAAMLTSVQGSLAKDKHRAVLGHVDHAIYELGIALKVR